MIKKGIYKHINMIPGRLIHKIALCRTAHFLRRVLSMLLQYILQKRQQKIHRIHIIMTFPHPKSWIVQNQK